MNDSYLHPQENLHSEAIGQRSGMLQEKLEALQEAATVRKARLVDNSAFLQFMWKTDVVESWISGGRPPEFQLVAFDFVE